MIRKIVTFKGAVQLGQHSLFWINSVQPGALYRQARLQGVLVKSVILFSLKGFRTGIFRRQAHLRKSKPHRKNIGLF